MKWYGIYINDTRIWGRFKTEEQAEQFISYYDLNNFKTSLKGDFNLKFENDLLVLSVENMQVGKMNFKKSFSDISFSKIPTIPLPT